MREIDDLMKERFEADRPGREVLNEIDQARANWNSFGPDAADYTSFLVRGATASFQHNGEHARLVVTENNGNKWMAWDSEVEKQMRERQAVENRNKGCLPLIGLVFGALK